MDESQKFQPFLKTFSVLSGALFWISVEVFKSGLNFKVLVLGDKRNTSGRTENLVTCLLDKHYKAKASQCIVFPPKKSKFENQQMAFFQLAALYLR